jgi:undecaprenyl-diphosphatase
MTHLTYLEAAVVGLIQGVTELFPVSSLGHNVLLPALVGGSWARDLNVAATESPYLAFIVGLHVATAIALLIYFWRDWVRIIKGFFSSLRQIARPAEGTSRWMPQSADEQLAWLIILATIPVGLAGLAFEHLFRVIFGKPVYAAVFLIVNGLILIAGERFRSRASLRADRQIAAGREHGSVAAHVRPAGHAAGRRDAWEGTFWEDAGPVPAVWEGEDPDYAAESDQRLAAMRPAQALVIGSSQVVALLAGISRDGITMVTGMARGLSREDAARFAFLLATPVILAAGALKIPDLMGPLGSGIHGQVVVGSILSGVGAYLSVRYLTRYFQTRTLTPFGVYCIIAGLASIAYLQFVR